MAGPSYERGHPRTGRPDDRSAPHGGRTALLVIEVADSSLRKDRGVRTVIYARYGIPEYRIVTVKNSTVEVHRDHDPDAGRYRTLLTVGPAATLSPTGVPGVSISVADLFA